MTAMNYIDLIIVGVVVVSTIIGILRGFTKEVLTLVTWGLAGYCAYRYGVALGEVFSGIDTVMIRQALGVAIIFISILIIGGLINYFISKLVDITGLSIIDKFLGGGLGLLRGGLVILLVIPVLATMAAEEPWWQNSELVPKFQAVSAKLITHVPQQWRDKANEISDNFKV